MPRRRPAVRALLVAIAVVLLFIVVQGVALGVLVGLGRHVDVTGRLSSMDAVALAAVQAAGIVVAALVVAAGLGSWTGLGLRERGRRIRSGLLALTPAGLLVVGPTIIAVVASGDRLLDRHVGVATGAAYVLLAVLIAVNEELWFRGLVPLALGGSARPWLVVLGSSVLFGLPHVSGDAASLLNAFAVTLAIGIPFAVVRLRHGSLLPLIFWHAVIDAWAFLHTASVVPGGHPSPAEIVASLVIPALVALSYLLVLERGRTAEAAATT